MPHVALVRAAARNNAKWCAAVCRSHGISSRFTDDAWLADGNPPPFYPRLLSLTADAAPLERTIHELRGRATEAFAVKDSFGVLAPSPTREKLFDAVWYARPPGPLAGFRGQSARVENRVELARWVSAWGGTPPHQSIFVPAILAEPGVAFLKAAEFRAGLAAHQSSEEGGFIGVTNLFGDAGERNACLASLIVKNPACTIAGYGPEDEAVSLVDLGFRVIGPLAVWLVSG